MGRQLVGKHAEDLALALGTVSLALGLGWKFGWWAALVAAGVVAIAYGVWITGGAEWASQATDE